MQFVAIPLIIFGGMAAGAIGTLNVWHLQSVTARFCFILTGVILVAAGLSLIFST